MAYFGDIESSVATQPARMSECAIWLRSGVITKLLITLLDGHFSVSPVQWIAEDKEYSFVSLTNKRLERVTGWRPFWTIKMNLAGRNLWRRTASVIASMANTVHTFTSSGVSQTKRFYFRPYGDGSRRSYEVVISAEDLNPEYFGDKLIGLRNIEIKIFGTRLFSIPILTDSMILPAIPEKGILLTGVAVRVDSRVA